MSRSKRRGRPATLILFFGVLYPAIVIAIELATRMCAEAFFDPMPTYGHVLAASLVPAGNLLVWGYLQNGKPRSTTWVAFANGVTIAIAGLYALLFLPLLPIALLAIIVAVGLLPLAPLASFVCALRLRAALHDRDKPASSRRPLLGGIVAGFALLLALDIPPAATRLGIQWAASSVPSERERGLTLLRTLGDDDLLLRLCYGATARPSGLLSAFVVFGDSIWLDQRQRQIASSPAEAREIYYRVHGEPFNARPAPFEKGKWSRFADFQFDNDHGGTQVGGRLKGLHMVSSRMDGSISGDDAVAYLEWTVEFRNSEPTDREARLQLALPPGGVVSRATLWVNGEEREAAYGGRGEVRAAYQRVAVQQRRDPLLVTTKGADRVLAQAFPVPRNGGTIKFKLGITAPMELIDASKARLTLPALVDRNFSFAADTSHSVWIESKQPLAASMPGATASRVDDRLFRVAGSVNDRDLSRLRQVITVDRNPDTGRLAARLGEGELVAQEVTRGTPAAAALMLVIDGSARLADTSAKLIEALDAIPPDIKVGAIIAVGADAAGRRSRPGPSCRSGTSRACCAPPPSSAARTTPPRWPRRCKRSRPSRKRHCSGFTGRNPSASATAPLASSRPPRGSSRLPACRALQRRAGPERIAARRALGLGRPFAAANRITGSRSLRLLHAHLGPGSDADASPAASSGGRCGGQRLRSHRAAVGERPRARADAGRPGRQSRRGGGARDRNIGW